VRLSKLLISLLLIGLNSAQAQELGSPDKQNLIREYLNRPRYYVLIGVNQIEVADNASLDYALVDIDEVRKALEDAGFKPLSDKAPLVGADATYKNVKDLLDDIPGLPDKATVLIYYTGHSWSDGKELWLQLFDNSKVGDDGYTFSSMVQKARGENWIGKLVVIVDSCYSGQATKLNRLPFSDLTGPTAILASSDPKQASLPIELVPGKKQSAFTAALLESLGEKFDEASQRRDGILTINDSRIFAQSELIKWAADKKINGNMKPNILENDDPFVLKYEESKRQVQDSPLITVIADSILKEVMSTPSQGSSSESKSSESFAKRVQSTAQELLPLLPAGPQRQAYEKMASGRVSEGLAEWGNIPTSVPTASLPTVARDKVLVAEAYLRLGQNALAASVFESILKENPAFISDQIKLDAARAYVGSNKLTASDQLLGEIIVSATSSSDTRTQIMARNLLGESYANRGQYKKAIDQFKSALALSPNTLDDAELEASVSSNLARTYTADKKFSDAEKQYVTTVVLNEKAGVPSEQQAVDLESYSKVLAANKKLDEASTIKAAAEALKDNSVVQKIQVEVSRPKQ